MKYLYIILMVFSFGIIEAQGVMSNTEGFSLKTFARYNKWNSNSYYLEAISNQNSNGLSFGVEIAYGLKRNLSFSVLYEGLNFNSGGDFDYLKGSLIDIGVRYNFLGSLHQWRPYIEMKGGWNILSIFPASYTDDLGTVFEYSHLKSKGAFFGAQFGVNYFVTPDFFIVSGINARFGKYSRNSINGVKIEINENVDFRFLSFHIGLGYSFY